MPNWTIPNFSNSSIGIEDMIIQNSSQAPQLVGALLFFIYVFILGAGYATQEKRYPGSGNLAMWSSISGLITTTGGFFLLLSDTIYSVELLSGVILSLLVTIISGIIFLTSERD